MSIFSDEFINDLSLIARISQPKMINRGELVRVSLSDYWDLNQSFLGLLKTDENMLRDIGTLYYLSTEAHFNNKSLITPWNAIAICSTYLMLKDSSLDKDMAWKKVVDYETHSPVLTRIVERGFVEIDLLLDIVHKLRS